MPVKSRAQNHNESALKRVLQMVAEVERGGDFDAGPDVRNTGFPAHVASDADKFAEIFKRLDALEKIAFQRPGKGISKLPDAAMGGMFKS